MAEDITHALTDVQNRQKQIFKTSIVGILVNFLLVGFKAFVGMASHSIAITLDAVNNLSDALSSIITIIGMKLAGKKPDKKHPMGHGRTEYLTSAVIAVLILYAGITALVNSVKKIITPVTPDYSRVTLVIVAVAVVVKLVLGIYVRKTGDKVKSDALKASGTDALFDSVISLSTLIAAAVYLIRGISLEAWLGVIIAVIIIKNGVDILRETFSKIIGERVDSDLAKTIKDTVNSVDGVYGTYDLTLNNYGPEMYLGSLHIEVDDTLTAADIDRMTRQIQALVLEKTRVFITAVGIYSRNTHDEKIAAMRDKIESIIYAQGDILQIHGFYYDESRKLINVDFVVDFAAVNPKEKLRTIKEEIQKAYPDCTLNVAMDTDISD
jgi:cation diffusion facilitator family transporter